MAQPINQQPAASGSGGQNVNVPKPEQGADVAVQSSANGSLALGFDPGEATASRPANTNDLVFELDGGKVTINGFFETAGGSLPNLTLPDGTVVAAAEFFDGAGLDLSTAAGPGGGNAGAGGAGDYGDNPGDLINGINRLGSLGTDYWGRATEVSEEFRALEIPGGTFGLDVQTNIEGAFRAVVYEDGKFDQHLYGDAAQRNPGQIFFNPAPTGTTVVTGVHLSGFHKGSIIEIGHPDDPGYRVITIDSPTQVVDFTAENFASPGVFITPPPDSDLNMNINATVDIRAESSGMTDTITGTFTIIVDAVADRPEELDAALSVTGLQTDTAGSTSKDGEGNIRSGEATNINLNLKAVFGDWEDGSERHFFDVNNIPTDWVLNENSIPDGWTLMLKDADGNYREVSYAEYQGYLQSLDGNGFYSLAFEVTDAATSGQGAVNEAISFNPGDWTSEGVIGENGEPSGVGRWSDGSLNDSGPARLEISAVAMETSDNDYDYSNNTSIVSTTTVELSLTEDTPDIDYGHVLFTDEQAWGQPWTDTEHGDIMIWDNAWASYESKAPGSVGSIIKDALAQIGTQGNITLIEDNNLLGVGPNKSSPVLGASTTTITYDLKSDGPADGTGGYGSQQGQSGLSIDLEGSELPEFAKLPKDVGYSAIVYESYTDADGNVCIVGYIDNGDGNRHVAIAITLQPGDLDGKADLTVIQYLAYEHEFGKYNNKSIYGIKVVVTDDDGDKASVTVTYVSEDDTPDARDDKGAYDERVHDFVDGNVLANDNAKADGWAADGDKPGGVVAYTIGVNDGSGQTYSIAVPDGQGGWTKVTSPEVGATYTILDGNGNAQGEFYLQANGGWAFTRADGCDVIRDFNITVKYTAQDADGDNAKAQLEVTVKAAPIMAGISGDEQVFESSIGDPNQGSVNDAAGVATYTIQAYNYDGSLAQGPALYEDVFVTLKLDFPASGGASLADFDFAALEGLNPGVEVSYDPATNEITVKIPAGDPDGSVKLNLPLADDSIGGKGTTTDGPVENYTLEVVSVSGDTTDHYLQPGDTQYTDQKINTAQDTSIIDDGTFYNDQTGQYEYMYNRLDGDKPYTHAGDKHPLDGPMFNLVSNAASGEVSEGKTVQCTLSALNPNSMTGDVYNAFTGTLSEQVVITLNLDYLGTADSSDLSLSRFGSYPAGVTVTITGTTVTITLPAGFDMNNLGKVGFNVNATNDNWGDETGEGFSVAITSVAGNESTYFGNAKEVIIIDDFAGKLTLTGDSSVWEGGDLTYTFTLLTDSEITSTNTGDVKAIVQFGGTATFGDDYNLDAIRDANADAKLTFKDLSGQPDGDGGTYPLGTVEITFPPSAWDNAGNAGNHNYTLKVPTTHDNQIAELDETLTITLKDASGAEIKSFEGTGTGTIEDRAAISLTAVDGSNRTHDIYENDGTNNPTVATYQVNWLHDDGKNKGELGSLVTTGKDEHTDKPVAASTFSFDLTLKDGTAKFDNNMLDNDTDGKFDNSGKLLSGQGDYGWAIGDKLIEYRDLNTPEGKADLFKALNDYLKTEFGTNFSDEQYIEVTGLSNDGRTLTFTVREGADLSEPLQIQVGAIDDRITEGTESFQMILSNIQGQDGGLGQNVIIDKDRLVNTDIIDDAGNDGRDGFLVALDKSTGQESDKFIELPVLLFERGPDGNPVDAKENNPPTQDITIFLLAGAAGDTADMNQDYYTDTPSGEITITIPAGNWEYVEASGTPGESDYVPAHWISTDVTIPLNDDRLTELNETFTVKLTDVYGHESSVLGDGAVNGLNGTATLTIQDDTLAAGNLDGPDLSSFGPMGQVIEPVAPTIDSAAPGGTQINADTVVNTVAWQVGMTQTVAQDTIVFIKIEDQTWSDFKPQFGDVFDKDTSGTFLGRIGDEPDHDNGIYTLAELKAMFPTYNIDSNGGGYFVIIPEGSASTTFNVDILHDHDTAANGTGVDPVKEYVDMTITNIQGSETVFDKDNPGTAAHSQEEILDDMKGPMVSLDTAYSNGMMILTVSMDATATEPVTVMVTITRADGTSYTEEISIPAGQTTSSLAMSAPSTDYIYTQITDTSGGETQRNSTVGFTDIGGSGGENPRISLGIEASNITEDVETSVVGYTITGNIPTGHVNEDLTFTLKVVNNTTEKGDFVEGSGPGNDIKITIPEELLAKCGDKFTLTIGQDDNGNPVVVMKDTNGNAVDQTDNPIIVVGDLPQAFDDKLIEGDESFSTIITNITGGGTVSGSNPVGTSTIEDNDKPIVKVVFCDEKGNILPVDAEGNPVLHGQEGQGDVYVKVILVDSEGNPLSLGNGAVTFDLTTDGSAKGGADFVLGQNSVVIADGKSESDVIRITLPDDFKSDGSVTLTITATPDENPTTVQNYKEGFIPGSTGGQTLTIDDYINGPQITFTADKTTVSENGSVNYWVTLDKALEEDATLTFKVALETDGHGNYVNTADGFVLDDIKSIQMGDETYYVVMPANPGAHDHLIGNDPAQPVHLDTDGNLIIKMTMDNGYSKEGFTINLYNDTISEGKELLNVTLTETKGGELGYGGTNTDGSNKVVGEGNMPSVKTTVTDFLDGPAISLVKVDAEGTEGESITVGISLDKATVSETTIILTLGEGVATDVVRGTTVTVTNGSNFSGTGTIDPATGLVTITLPAGVNGPLHVTFPLQDNAISGNVNQDFSISLNRDGVVGGEASLAGNLNYGADFMSETNTTTVFSLSGNGTGAPGADATCTITLSGIPGNDSGKVASLTVTVDGQTYTVSGDQLTVSNGVLTYTLPDKVGTSLDGVKVTVTYDTTAMSPEDLASAKLNANVSGSLSGMELTLAVLDDPASWDGPVFSVAADTASVAEGGDVVFTISPNPQGVFTVVEEPDGIVLTFTISGDSFNGTVTVVSGTDSNITDYDVTPLGGGKYSITLPQGTDLTKSLTVTVGTEPDTVIGTDGTVSLELVSVDGGESSISGTDTAKTEITEGSSAVVHAVAGMEVTEGKDLSVTLSLLNTGDTSQKMTATEPIDVMFSIAAADIGLFLSADTIITLAAAGISYKDEGNNLTWTYNGHNSYLVTTTVLVDQAGGVEITIPTIDNSDGIIGDAHEVTLQLVNVNGYNLNVSLTGDIPVEFTINDADTMAATAIYSPANVSDLYGMTLNDLSNIEGNVHDFSNAENGQFVIGSDADEQIIGSNHGDIIYGGAGKDTIYGGSGDDIIHAGPGGSVIHGGDGNDLLIAGSGDDTFFGGAGEDTFQWNKGGLGGTDTIMDFNITEGDKIELHGLFDEPTSLDELLSNFNVEAGAGRDSLGVNVLDGNALELTIHSDGNLLQTIIVHGVDDNGTSIGQAYNDASDAGKLAAFLNEMLIITNTG